MQTITVCGNVGQDPDMRYTSNGKAVLRFSVADNYKSGETEITTWFDVQAWGPLAELYANEIKRGTYVTVTGRVDLNEWERDGVKHAKLRITADAIGTREPRESGSQATAPTNAQHRPTTTPQPAPAQVADEEADPFGDQ